MTDLMVGKSERSLDGRGLRTHLWYAYGPEGGVTLEIQETCNLEAIQAFRQMEADQIFHQPRPWNANNREPGFLQWFNGVPYMAIDLGTHSKTPFAGASKMAHCEILDGADCYYDGSTSAAAWILAAWIEAEGDNEVVYELLRQRHRQAEMEMFGGNPDPTDLIAEAESFLKNG